MTIADLKASALDPALATFALISAIRPVEKGDPLRVVLSFEPSTKGIFFEMLTLNSPKAAIKVALKGVGIAPEVTLSPDTATTSGAAPFKACTYCNAAILQLYHLQKPCYFGTKCLPA